MEKNIVIIDNNLAIREVLKALIKQMADANNIGVNLYTSENGVEGLGFLYVAEPSIVILDTTLPKYSGNELLYYVLTNKRFHSEKIKVLIITEDKRELRVPENFSVLTKTDPAFLTDLLDKIAENSNLKSSKKPRFMGLGSALISYSNKLDLFRENFNKTNLLHKLLYLVPLALFELYVSVLMIVGYFVIGHVEDANIKQGKRDLLLMRRKHYPNIIMGIVSLVILALFMSSFFYSQNLLLQDQQEESSAFGAIKWFSTFDTEADITTPFTGSSAEILGNPDFETGYGGNGLEFDANGEAVRIVDPILNTDYSLEKGAVEFFYKPIANHTVDSENTFFSIYYDVNNKIEFKKMNDGNDSLALSYICSTCQAATEIVDGADYVFTAGEWVKLRVEWNSTENVADQLKIFVDDTLVPSTDNSSAIDSSAITPAEYIYIGNSTESGTNEAQGVIDEFAIYTNVFPPTATPVGTPAPTPVFTQYSGPASWYSTLNNLTAITTPAIGTGGVLSGASFVDGPNGYGNAAHFDTDGESVDVPIDSGIDYSLNEGAVEFYYRPVIDSDEDSEINLFSIRVDDNNELRFYKKDNAGNNELSFSYTCPGDCDGEETVAEADYGSLWNPGDWMFFRLEWDDEAILADQLVIQINETVLPHTDQTGSIDPDSFVGVPELFIGNRSTDGTNEANGTIDEFKIYLDSVIPTATITPIPSDTPTPTITPTPSITPTITPTPIWYSTMDSLDALNNPVIGSPLNVYSGISFVPGIVNNATRFDQNDYARVIPTESDFNITKGRITFYYKPDSLSINNKYSGFFSFLKNDMEHGFSMYKDTGNNLRLVYNNTGVASTNRNSLLITSSNFNWVPNQWIFFEILYDTTLTDPDLELRLFMDGIEPAHTHEDNNQVSTVIDFIDRFYFGTTETGSQLSASGLIDEFKVYNYFVAMPTPTVIINTPTPTPLEELELLWHSTLDTQDSMTSPLVGTGMTNFSGIDYVTYNDGTRNATGIELMNSNDGAGHFSYPANGYNVYKGKIELWYKPNVASNHSSQVTMFSLQESNGNSRIRLVRTNSGNGSVLEAQFWRNALGTQKTVRIAHSDYVAYWPTSGSFPWIHFAVEWDVNLPADENVKILVNGNELPQTVNQLMDPGNMPAFTKLIIGNTGSNSNPFQTAQARGIIDEFKVWGASTGPTNTPTPTPSPYPTTPAEPIWYSTMNDAAALSSPEIGNPVTSSDVSFSPAVYGNGAMFNADNMLVEVASIPLSQFNNSKGAIEFYFTPNHEEDFSAQSVLLNIAVPGVSNDLKLIKRTPALNNVLAVQYSVDGNMRQTYINTSDYGSIWQAGEPMLIRVEWDVNAPYGEDLRLLLNNTEPAHVDTGSQLSSMPGDFNMRIGNDIANSTIEARGIIDEFKVFGDPNSRNYIVNSIGDEEDNNIGDKSCQTAEGTCTLRAAIAESNDSDAVDNIYFDIPGDGPHIIAPNSSLPTITKSARVDGASETGSNCSALDLKVVLDGSNTNGNGLTITGDDVTIKGLVIYNFTNGINFNSSANSAVYCNIIGLSTDGLAARGNSSAGINVNNESDNITIGGQTANERNLISANFKGIVLSDSDAATIMGNYIGTDVTGAIGRGNTNSGIEISNSDNLEIGGTDGIDFDGQCQGDCNLISANGGAGIFLTAGASVSDNVDIIGNYIGTNLAGNSNLRNFDGIKLTKANTVVIDQNLLTAQQNGIYASTVTNSDLENLTITNNVIGLEKTSAAKLGTGSNGIVLFSGVSSTLSEITVSDNVIGGMTLAGVYVYGQDSSDITIASNYIGTNASGANLGNKYGIWYLYPHTNNVIGGADPANGNYISYNTSYGLYLSNTSDNLVENNTITNNGSDGVAISGVGSSTGAVNNTLIENSIYDNTRLAINLRLGSGDGAFGVTHNDDGDADQTADPDADGPNDLQNFPYIINSIYDVTNLNLYGIFNSKPNHYYRLDFYSNENEDPSGFGEAQNHIHTEVVQTNSVGNFDFSQNPIEITGLVLPNNHENFSATATECLDSDCNVSELLSTSELGRTGFETTMVARALSLDAENDKLYIAASGTDIIADLFAYSLDDLDPENPTLDETINTSNFYPMSVAALDSTKIAAVGSGTSGQYRVYPLNSDQNFCAAVNLENGVKATSIAVASNSIGSKYAFVTTEDEDQELVLIRGGANGSSVFPLYGEYMSEIRDFDIDPDSEVVRIPYYHSVTWEEEDFGTLDIMVQVRTGTTPDLANETWYGPDGTSGSYFDSPGDVLPEVVQGKRYFQYRLLLRSNQTVSPRLDAITVRYGE